MRVFLIGFMGSGKSHWGRILQDALKINFYDLDSVIEKKENQTIAEIFESKGEEYFRRLEHETLDAMIQEHPDMILSCGGGTPCFFKNIDLMKKSGTVVWLNPAVEALVKRLVKEKDKRPLLKEVSDEALHSFILKKMNDRRIYYEQAHVHVEEDKATPASLIEQIVHA